MTGHLKIDLPETAGARVDILYGSPCYQIRLWHLDPGAVLSPFPVCVSGESQSIPISGTCRISHDRADLHLPVGQRFLLSGRNPGQVENAGSQPLRLLEVCWGEGYTAVPLAEVTEIRPWGSFTVLKDEPDFKLKQLIVKPGNRLSLQRHQKRAEHWVVTQGQSDVTLDDGIYRLHAGQYIHIPRHSWHRITNPTGEGGETVEIIELQLGDYFGEDDIERREDDYGRV